MEEGALDKVYEYVGDISQVADIRECRLSGGKAAGVRAVDVSNGSGLEYTVLPDRCMDILSIKYRGTPLHYRTGTGVTAPEYYNDSGTEWLRSFYAGALTTCGLLSFGQPQLDQGKQLGLHGRISNTPAEDFGVLREREGEDYFMRMQGVMRESSAFGENLSMIRRVETKLWQKGFRITDIVRNNGYKSVPLMLLYHFNFGYPFLNAESKILGPIIKTEAGNEHAASNEALSIFDSFGKPVSDYPDQLFFHRLAADENGKSFIALVNERGIWGDTPLAAVIRFDEELLPYLFEWKVLEKQNYLVCLEPANCQMRGREELREEGNLPQLEGLEERKIVIDYEIIDSEAGLEGLREEAELIKRVYKKRIENEQ